MSFSEENPQFNKRIVIKLSERLLVHDFLYRYVNTRIVTVALDPAPEKLQQDVILKFKNLKVT